MTTFGKAIMLFINDVIELEYLQRDLKVLFSIINLSGE